MNGVWEGCVCVCVFGEGTSVMYGKEACHVYEQIPY